MTIERLEAKLQTLATLPPDIVSTARTLDLLIRGHHVRPDVRHYRAMILANCDPLRGCARQVRALLGEMEPNGIPVDSGTLHTALQVCMIGRYTGRIQLMKYSRLSPFILTMYSARTS